MKKFIGILILISLIVFLIYYFSFSEKQPTMEDNFKNIIKPKVIEYNKSKGTDNPNITVKGNSIVMLDFYDDFGQDEIRKKQQPYLNYTEFTLFIIVDQKNETIESGYYYPTSQYGARVGGSSLASTYQYTTDIVVVYYPSMEIAGWHRIVGPMPGNLKETGVPPSETGIKEWITSLPGFTPTELKPYASIYDGIVVIRNWPPDKAPIFTMLYGIIFLR